MEELVPEPYRTEGWEYRDIPGWISRPMYELLRRTIGFDEHRILVHSQKNIDDQMMIHAQMIVSPNGFANLRKYQERHG